MNIVRLLSLHIQEAFYVRSQAFVWFLIVLINPLIYLMFWQAALGENPNLISSNSTASITTYYVILIIAEALLMAHVEIEVAIRDIYEGRLSQYLLKPIPYIAMKFFQEIPWRLIQAFFGVVVFLILRVLWPEYILLHYSFLQLVLLIPILLGAFILSFLFKMILGLTAIWTTDFRGLSQVSAVILFIMAGYVIPLHLLPPVLFEISRLLPFAYMIYFPVMVAQGSISGADILQGISIQVCWIVAFMCMYHFMWRQAMRKFSGVGD